MAVEDAAALAETLRNVSQKVTIADAISVFEEVRMPRVKQVHDATTLHGYTLHLSDGPEQRRRDQAMEREVNGEHFVWSPNQWSDPTVTSWMCTHRPALAVRKAWANRKLQNGTGEHL